MCDDTNMYIQLKHFSLFMLECEIGNPLYFINDVTTVRAGHVYYYHK